MTTLTRKPLPVLAERPSEEPELIECPDCGDIICWLNGYGYVCPKCQMCHAIGLTGGRLRQLLEELDIITLKGAR